MIDLSNIPASGRLGKLMRLPLKCIPHGTVLPILQGRLRGYRWVSDSASHGCWLGTYERAKQELFSRHVTSASVVYDVGANVGFYTLLSAACVGARGRVYAFEPFPGNVILLQRHLSLNRLSNATVLPWAVSNTTGLSRFASGAKCETGRLDANGELEVKTVTLDDFVYRSGNPPPDFVKVDVEGAELSVLQGAPRTFAQKRPILFLATHGKEIHAKCLELLQSYRYKATILNGDPEDHLYEVFCSPT